MSDDDDWVARLLGSAERPTMPTDVADRLDRTLRAHIDGDVAAGPDASRPDAAGPVAAGPVAAGPVAAGPVAAVTAAETHREQDATGAQPAADEVPGPTAGTDTPLAPAASTGPVPPAAVPPPASSGTGVLPVLRAGTTAADDPTVGAEGTAPGTEGADDAPTTSTTRTGRTFGSSRREQRAEDEGERRRRLLVRWAPVAAGVLVLGGAGIAVSQLTSGQDSAVETASEEAAAGAAEAVAPRALVATGTEYQTGDEAVFAQQVRDLVSVAASAESGDAALSAPAEESDTAGGAADGSADDAAPEVSADAGLDASAAREAVAGSPLADATALQECVDRVTDTEGDVALAVDEAVVDGVESTVVVVEDPAGASLFVYVVGPDCADSSQFDFYTVTP